MSKDKVSAYMTGSFPAGGAAYKNRSTTNMEQRRRQVITETVKLGRPVAGRGRRPRRGRGLSSNVLTDMMTRVIVDKVTPEKAVEEADKPDQEIYDRLP